MTIAEIKSAHEFAAELLDTVKAHNEPVPTWMVERMMELWGQTIDIYKADESQTFYIYEFEGQQTVVNKQGTEVWPFFREVAAIIAMSDLSNQYIRKVVHDGKEYHYAGWAPGMEFTFVDNGNSENTYTVWMEHLDH